MELIRKYTTIHLENQSFAYFPNGAVRPRMISHIEDLVDVYLETPRNLREYTPEMEREGLVRERELELLRRQSDIARERRNAISEQHRIMEENQRQQYRRQKLREVQSKERMIEKHIERLEKKITICDFGIIICCVLIALCAILVVIDMFEYPYGILLLAPQWFFIYKKKKLMDFKISADIEQYEVRLERLSVSTNL